MLYVDGKPTWNDYRGWTQTSLNQPSYYFTHERTGGCAVSSLADQTILAIIGYKDVSVGGKSPDANKTMVGHEWTEALIDGGVYVVNFNWIFPREGFNTKNCWTIDQQSGYDPNWYMK